MSMEQLREAVLQAKDIAQELPQGAALERDAFIQACTRAARNYVAQPQLAGNADAFRDIVRREVHLALASAGLIHGDHKAAIRGGASPATTARGTPRVAATPRTARTTPQKAATSASASVAATPRSASCASSEKVEALKAIKPYLEPAFRNGALSREDFSAIALRLTDSFCDRFRANGSPAGASVSDTERQWIQSMVQREIDIVTQAVAAANASTPSAMGHATNTSGHGASSSPPRLGSSGAPAGGAAVGDSGSPFEQHIRKLREFVETSEQDESAGTASGSHAAVSSQVRGRSTSSGTRRAVLVSEISQLQQQLAAISAQLGDKVAELATLE